MLAFPLVALAAAALSTTASPSITRHQGSTGPALDPATDPSTPGEPRSNGPYLPFYPIPLPVPVEEYEQPSFPDHRLFKVNDNHWIPSPSFSIDPSLEPEETVALVRQALQVGYRHLDTAGEDGNLESIGQAIALEGIPREELFITCKFERGFDIPTNRTNSVQLEWTKDITALGVSYFDMWMIHHYDRLEFFSRVYQKFEWLKTLGLVKSIGVVNFTPDQLTETLGLALIKPALHLVDPDVLDPDTLAQSEALSKQNGILVGSYSPVALDRSGEDKQTVKAEAQNINTLGDFVVVPFDDESDGAYLDVFRY